MPQKTKKRDELKVLFFITGIGYGDSTREHSNIVAFKKKYPKSKILIACYDNSYDYFKDKYPTIKIKGYKLTGDSLKINWSKFALQNLLLPTYWTIGALKVRLQEFKFNPDLIITDFEPAGISLSRLLNKKCISVFGFDPILYEKYKKENKTSIKEKVQAFYYKNIYHQADMAIIPTLIDKRQQHLEYTYINPSIRITPEELDDEKTLMQELKLKKKPILIMLGGSNFGKLLTNHLTHLADKFKEEFIIFGGDLNQKFPKNIKYIRYTPEFLKYLKVCKGIITLGGQKTLAEALIYKKPILSFPIKEHIEQQLNAYSIKDLIIVSHKHTRKDFETTLKEFIKEMPSLQNKVNNYELKTNGAQQMLKIIQIALEKI